MVIYSWDGNQLGPRPYQALSGVQRGACWEIQMVLHENPFIVKEAEWGWAGSDVSALPQGAAYYSPGPSLSP